MMDCIKKQKNKNRREGSEKGKKCPYRIEVARGLSEMDLITNQFTNYQITVPTKIITTNKIITKTGIT
jgi:succinate dehydrogenase flavin-adding protein (antitoxin of CptAB toxin-antitoxin module)